MHRPFDIGTEGGGVMTRARGRHHRHSGSLLLIIAALALFPAIAAAANTFEESTGRFAIDLPDGYSLAKTAENSFSFEKKDSPTISVIFVPTPSMEIPNFEYVAFFGFTEGVKTTLAKDPPPSFSGLSKVTVNGNPGVWGTLGGKYHHESGMKFDMVFSAGSASLKGGAGVVSAGYLANKKAEAEPMVKKAFSSLRNPGSAATGIMESAAITPEEIAAKIPK